MTVSSSKANVGHILFTKFKNDPCIEKSGHGLTQNMHAYIAFN